MVENAVGGQKRRLNPEEAAIVDIVSNWSEGEDRTTERLTERLNEKGFELTPRQAEQVLDNLVEEAEARMK